MATKVNRLWQQIPHGAVVTTAWLETHGISANHAAKLTEAGWLKRLGRGAYCRAGDPLTWESGVFALQALSDPAAPPFWPGGQTALALQGFAHYLPMGHDTTRLYGAERRSQLPLWLSSADWAGAIDLHQDKGLPVDLPGSLTDYSPPGAGLPYGYRRRSALSSSGSPSRPTTCCSAASWWIPSPGSIRCARAGYRRCWQGAGL